MASVKKAEIGKEYKLVKPARMMRDRHEGLGFVIYFASI
jgi:hypothetical protein